MATEDELRKQAERRLKAQQGFKVMLGGFVIVWLITIGVWWLSGGGYFWPAWVIFGTLIATFFTGWNAYGPREGQVSEGQIDDEVRKMKGE